jgi:hypothetical protein
VESESFGLFCPELANTLEGRQPSQTLKALGKVVGIKKRGEVRTKTAVRLVVEPADCRVLDGPIHPFDLAVGPGVIELGEAVVDAELGACQVKSVGSERLLSGEQLLDFSHIPAAFRRRELKAVVPSQREVMTERLLL